VEEGGPLKVIDAMISIVRQAAIVMGLAFLTSAMIYLATLLTLFEL